MQFKILGPTEVLDGDRWVVLPAGRGRALLALLIIHAGEVVAAERLVDELWGETPPPTARTALQGLVSRLRKRLEPGRASEAPATVLRTAPLGYVLAVDPASVDAHRFRRLLAQAHAAAPAEQAATLRTALDLWRGPALADFTYEPFAQREIAALAELRLAATEQRVEADLALGRHAQLVAEVESLVAAYPFRERLHAQLILALYRAGRQADALDAFRTARRALVEELGIEPGPELRRLEQQVLRQDPALDLPAAPSGSPTVSTEQTWLPRERRLVTAVFVQVTPAGGDDPEARDRDAGRALEAAAALTRHGGTVTPAVGDELVGLFGTPVAHEDDALRAVRAASEVCQAVRARVGVETGEVVVDAAGGAVSAGGVIRAASRLQHGAADGETVVGEATRRLVDLAAAATLRADPPMVGRTAELARLRAALDACARDGTGRRLTVVGEAGVGKSRLARELAATAGTGVRVLTGRCPAYGDGITFWPLREIVLQAAAPATLADLLGEDDAGQVATAVGLTHRPDPPDQLFPAVRRLLERLAADAPLLVTLEDLHWAEPALLDLLDYLDGRIRGGALLLCQARPELIEHRPEWASDAVVLEPLGQAETERLARQAAGRALPAGTLASVAETAQGNPLFVEQLVAALADGQVGTIPTSLRALLAARLDRLGPGERDLLRCAAVVGSDVPDDAFAALVPEQAQSHIHRHLTTLQRRQLIDPAPGGFRFRHALVRLAAYRSMTRADRAWLHERYADWLAHEARQVPPERDEILGYHLEQAVTHRRALGEEDSRTSELATRAGEHLAAAAVRAFSQIRDMAAAAGLSTRARSLLPRSHARRREVMDVLTDTYPPLGRHDEAEAVLSEQREEALAVADHRRAQLVRLKQARIELDTRPAGVTEVRQEAEHALAESAASGDDAMAAQAAYLLTQVHRLTGATGPMAEVARRGLAHADRSGLVRAEIGLRYAVSWATQAGQTPAKEAIECCEQLAWRRGTLHPPVLLDLAVLRAMRGEPEEARALVGRAREHLAERMRVRRPLMFTAQYAAAVAVLAGDDAAAERELRTALRMAREMGERDYLAQAAAESSRVLTRLGHADEAADHAALARHVAPAGSASQALWRTATVRLLVHNGRCHEAARLAAEAAALAPAGMLNLRADVLLDQAAALRVTGDRDAAATRTAEAVALYERKGNLVSAGRAHQLGR